MKKTIIILFSCIWFSYVHGQTQTKASASTNYCLVVRGDDEVLLKDGKEVTDDVKLKSGDQLSPNGRLMKMNGKEVKLKEGDCVTEDGKVIRGKKEEL